MLTAGCAAGPSASASAVTAAPAAVPAYEHELAAAVRTLSLTYEQQGWSRAEEPSRAMRRLAGRLMRGGGPSEPSPAEAYTDRHRLADADAAEIFERLHADIGQAAGLSTWAAAAALTAARQPDARDLDSLLRSLEQVELAITHVSRARDLFAEVQTRYRRRLGAEEIERLNAHRGLLSRELSRLSDAADLLAERRRELRRAGIS